MPTIRGHFKKNGRWVSAYNRTGGKKRSWHYDNKDNRNNDDGNRFLGLVFIVFVIYVAIKSCN